MRVYRLLFVCALSLFSVFSWAEHRQFHSSVAKADQGNAQYYMNCEIAILNDSYEDVRVTGVFDDGTRLWPANVYSFESPYYIPLYYYGYCHAGMNIYIYNLYGNDLLYAGYVRTGSMLHVYSPYFKAQAKVKLA